MIVHKAAGGTLIFPYTRKDMKADNPDESFPKRELSDAVLAEIDAYHLDEDAKPAYDPNTEAVVPVSDASGNVVWGVEVASD